MQFIDPINNQPLTIQKNGLMENGELKYPFINGAYRIVEDNNYTGNFGYQWNRFIVTQIDKVNQLSFSKDRFFSQTGWDIEDVAGKNILEVGSGAGRFSQVILENTTANLYSIDYSNAVEANYKNNGPNQKFHLFQASIYEMPFAKEQFDKVICFGVLQHTPDVERSVRSLIEMAKPGAEVIVDFYPINGWWTKLHAKYIFRFYTRKLSNEKLYKKIDDNIDWLIKTYRFFSKIGLGKIVNRFLPICDIDATLPKNMDEKQVREWCILDTFDMFSPEYDQPQRVQTVVNWYKKNGMTDVWGGKIIYANNVEATVVKGKKSFG
jgi:2-polyprenyl-3-methyl-5-hydroxy-6-metoxy-1,4-benzoquinol methylase